MTETHINVPDDMAEAIREADAETRRQRGIDRHLPAESQFDLETKEGRAAAYERANELSEELADIDRETKATTLPSWQRRIAEHEWIRDSAQDAIDRLEHQRDSALKGIEQSREWRLDWLDHWRQQPEVVKQLRITKAKRSIPLVDGEYRFYSNPTKQDWVHDINGRRDDEAIAAAVGDLYDLGLVATWDALNPPGERKPAVSVIAKRIELDGEGRTWWCLTVESIPPELEDRVTEDEGTITPFETDRETGEVMSYAVRFRARAEIRHPDGTIIRTVESLRRVYTPEDRGEPAYTREFVPAGAEEPGQTEETEESNGSGTDE